MSKTTTSKFVLPAQTDPPENEYIDLYAVNTNNINVLPVPVSFNQTRNLPFIDNPSEYKLSVIRFNLDSQSLPVFAPTIQYNQTDRDKTIYGVTLSYTNPLVPHQLYNIMAYVTWIPQDKVAAVPPIPSKTTNGFQDDSTGYYFAYNYSYWIQLCNTALQTAFTALQAAVALDGLVLPTTHAPVLTWNVDKMTAILNTDVLGYNSSAANHVSVYFNLAMYQLFNSMPAYLMSHTDTIGRNYLIDTNSFGNSTVTSFPFYLPTYNAIQTFQEQSSVSLWSPINAIVFTSNTLPINTTNVCNPVLFVNGSALNGNGNNGDVQQVITDFQNVDNLFKNNIVYVPTAQYRFVDLLGNTPLYNIDINVFWRNKVGSLIPFRLVASASASIKILFQRK